MSKLWKGVCKSKLHIMIINLWFNKDMNKWRWTLTDPVTFDMESGQQDDLRVAMTDIANTVEYLISNNQDNKISL